LLDPPIDPVLESLTSHTKAVSEVALCPVPGGDRKGYADANLPADTMTGTEVIAAYHDLWQVEKSFRMAKSDLRARPIFHHKRESIEAHLSVVFAALAVSRHLQDATGTSISKLVRTLRAVRSVTIRVNGHEITLDPDIPATAQAILDQLPPTVTKQRTSQD
jgi:hypothetical protein